MCDTPDIELFRHCRRTRLIPAPTDRQEQEFLDYLSSVFASDLCEVMKYKYFTNTLPGYVLHVYVLHLPSSTSLLFTEHISNTNVLHDWLCHDTGMKTVHVRC